MLQGEEYKTRWRPFRTTWVHSAKQMTRLDNREIQNKNKRLQWVLDEGGPLKEALNAQIVINGIHLPCKQLCYHKFSTFEYWVEGKVFGTSGKIPWFTIPFFPRKNRTLRTSATINTLTRPLRIMWWAHFSGVRNSWE